MSASNESMTFYSSGVEATWFQRTCLICDFPVTYGEPTVCLKGNTNCGRCEKCLRTIDALYVRDKLDDYQGSFDVEYFDKHKHRMLVKIRSNGIGRYMNEMHSEIYPKLRGDMLACYFLLTVEAYLFQHPWDKMIHFAKQIAKKYSHRSRWRR